MRYIYEVLFINFSAFTEIYVLNLKHLSKNPWSTFGVIYKMFWTFNKKKKLWQNTDKCSAPETLVYTPETPAYAPETLVYTPETLVYAVETMVYAPETLISAPNAP